MAKVAWRLHNGINGVAALGKGLGRQAETKKAVSARSSKLTPRYNVHSGADGRMVKRRGACVDVRRWSLVQDEPCADRTKLVCMTCQMAIG